MRVGEVGGDHHIIFNIEARELIRRIQVGRDPKRMNAAGCCRAWLELAGDDDLGKAVVVQITQHHIGTKGRR